MNQLARARIRETAREVADPQAAFFVAVQRHDARAGQAAENVVEPHAVEPDQAARTAEPQKAVGGLRSAAEGRRRAFAPGIEGVVQFGERTVERTVGHPRHDGHVLRLRRHAGKCERQERAQAADEPESPPT